MGYLLRNGKAFPSKCTEIITLNWGLNCWKEPNVSWAFSSLQIRLGLNIYGLMTFFTKILENLRKLLNSERHMIITPPPHQITTNEGDHVAFLRDYFCLIKIRVLSILAVYDRIFLWKFLMVKIWWKMQTRDY